ncbi:MAG: hypothetical protein PHV37_07120 [Candidatus Gastranaerophilales bacterium]|nr:hypothetical protein [Candidatus Gastranaerophilales bacterium]
MKKFFIIFILFLSCITTGCNKQKPLILLNKEPVTTHNYRNIQKTFSPNQRIYYAFLNPKGFKDSVIRIQVMKKDDKVPFLAYSVAWANDIYIDRAKNYHLGFLTLPSGGYYIMRVFYLKNLDKPLAMTDFWIK